MMALKGFALGICGLLILALAVPVALLYLVFDWLRGPSGRRIDVRGDKA